MNVFLDDFRPCPRGFVHALNVEQCLQLLETYDVHILSLDYDLGWGQANGTDLTRLMVERGLYAEQIYLHSSSPAGRSRMYEILNAGKPNSVALYHHPVPQDILAQIAKDALTWEANE